MAVATQPPDAAILLFRRLRFCRRRQPCHAKPLARTAIPWHPAQIHLLQKSRQTSSDRTALRSHGHDRIRHRAGRRRSERSIPVRLPAVALRYLHARNRIRQTSVCRKTSMPDTMPTAESDCGRPKCPYNGRHAEKIFTIGSETEKTSDKSTPRKLLHRLSHRSISRRRPRHRPVHTPH